jgi:flagella basal body P-ring formation protein FlgA
MLVNEIKCVLRLSSVVIASFLSLSSFAANFESVDHLSTLTKNFVLKNVPVDAGDTIDVKVNAMKAGEELPVCSKEIAAAFPVNTNPEQITSIELTCTGTTAWHTLIPVDVVISTQILVAKQNILPKQEITEDLLEYASYNKNRLYGSAFKEKHDVIGQVAAYMISAGTAFTKKNLQAPILIHRNEFVNLTVKSRSVSVAMQGVAKTDGAINTVIKVYNPSSKRTIDAVVTGPNNAEVVA